MGKRDHRQDAGDAAAAVRRLLAAVESGELDAGSGLVARLEGAAVALEHVAETPEWAYEKRESDPHKQRGRGW